MGLPRVAKTPCFFLFNIPSERVRVWHGIEIHPLCLYRCNVWVSGVKIFVEVLLHSLKSEQRLSIQEICKFVFLNVIYWFSLCSMRAGWRNYIGRGHKRTPIQYMLYSSTKALLQNGTNTCCLKKNNVFQNVCEPRWFCAYIFKITRILVLMVKHK